jgi:alpha-D-ribose 1-methylphosphonate 5-triphosphate synthase subunit PhnG
MSESTVHSLGDKDGDGATEARRARLSTLARAPEDALRALWEGWLDGAAEPAHETLRPAEIGTVMVRGRAGAKGAPFNLGEMTVTRCSVRLAGGAVGHGHVQGRSREAARIAALIDALSEAGEARVLEAVILAPLRLEADARRKARAAKAAATKVEFFTMVRGDNA